MLTIFFRNQVVHKKIRRQGGKNILIHVYLTNLFLAYLNTHLKKKQIIVKLSISKKIYIYYPPPMIMIFKPQNKLSQHKM